MCDATGDTIGYMVDNKKNTSKITIMKTKNYLRTLSKLVTAAFCFLLICSSTNAQNIFPSSGRAGIYTTSPAASLQIRGGARIGTLTNYVNIDSATGNLSFTGTSAYLVQDNSYAFRAATSSNIGLFFNKTAVQYEFRNTSAAPVFYVGANSGNGVFTGGLQVGNSSINNAGNIRWTGTDFQGYNGSVWKSLTTGTSYTAGTGISIANNVITNTAPDKIVTIAAATNMAVIGNYPNFAITYIDPPWFTNGNTGTDSSINFIGTSDAHPLAFRVNNQKSGWIDFTGNNNTSLGYQGLLANTTGFLNTALGSNTLKANITGGRNTSIGAYTLVTNNADNNTAIGVYALSSNTSGAGNTAAGVNALAVNTTGNNNAAYGINSLESNITGNENTAAGYAALYQNQTGSYNTATGSGALNSNTADFNTAHGAYALYENTSGSGNTASGYQSQYFSTTGSNNTAIGYVALYNNITGSLNVAIGHAASYQTTGSGNTSVGEFALGTNSTGSYNTAIGISSGPASEDLSFTTAVGYGASTSSSNQIRIGSVGLSGDPTSIGGKVGWSTLSDGRVKKNIKENVPGLTFINKLKPITYNIDNNVINQIIQRPAIKSKEAKEMNPLANDFSAAKTASTVIYTGFIAQDVEKAAKSLNYDFSGVDAAKNDKDLYGLRYADFVVPLVKAVQELSAKNDDLQKQIDDLKAMIVSNQSSASKKQSVILSSASLDQNIPNPFAKTTTITYTLPKKFATAQIIITDNTGKTLKAVNVSGSGKGILNVDAAILSSGAYNYSLIVDGKLIGSKQMILAK